MEADFEAFSIREYSRKIRSVDVRKCWPFSGEITGDLIHSILPPITVANFRWWSHELASLLANPPMAVDDTDLSPKVKSRQCKKRSIVEILAAAPSIQLESKEDGGDYPDVAISSKRKKTKDLVVQKKSDDSCHHKCREQAGEKLDWEKCSLGIEESSGVISLSSNNAGSISKAKDSEFQIPGILKAKRKVSIVKSPDKSKTYASQCERQSGNLSQLKMNLALLDVCCLEMNRLNLSSSEDQSSENDKETKVLSNDQNGTVMDLESRQENKFLPAVSERQLSHGQARSGLSCFPGPYLSSLERLKDALDLEEKVHVVQSFSQHASTDMHCGTLMYQSPSVLYRERYVEEVIWGFPLSLQGDLVQANGECCRSFDQPGSGIGSSKSASTENDLLLRNLVDFSTDPALAKDDDVCRFPMHNEKRHKYFPTRLGVDETFTEKAFLISDSNDRACSYTEHSSVWRSHAINLSKQDGLNQNLNSRYMVANRDGLCLHNTQATMRLMGKDVSVGKSYSDASIDSSSLSRRRTLGVSGNHSTTTLDNNWNRNLLGDTSKDPFPMFYEPRQARTAPTILNSCCCSLAPFPVSDKDLSFHGSGLGQPNSFTFSHQELPFPIYYNNVDIGLIPDARKPFCGLPFSDISFINHEEQLVPLYDESKSASSYIDVGTTKKRVASIEEYPMKNHKIQKLQMQVGLTFEKCFFTSQQIRKSQF